MQLNYLPSIQQYCLFAQLATINLNLEEYYDRGTERNRTLIASANGPLLLVIPTGKLRQQIVFIKLFRLHTKNLGKKDIGKV